MIGDLASLCQYCQEALAKSRAEAGAPTGVDCMAEPPHTLIWHKVAEVGELPEGRVRSVTATARQFALVHFDGRYAAMDNRCPHQGAHSAKVRSSGASTANAGCAAHGMAGTSIR
jgi:hypothetical protein